MPKPLVQDVARQVKQITEETIKEAAKQPGEMAGAALEQLGVASGKPSQAGAGLANQKTRLEELKRRDAALSRQRVAEIEVEIRELRKVREEQLRQRRQQPETPTQPVEEPALVSPAAKPKRGLFGAGKRIKSAQQKSQPETASRRIGG